MSAENSPTPDNGRNRIPMSPEADKLNKVIGKQTDKILGYKEGLEDPDGLRGVARKLAQFGLQAATEARQASLKAMDDVHVKPRGKVRRLGHKVLRR